MALPSREIIKRAALVTITVAIVSITSSAGIRLLLGVPSDSITIIIRIVLPFLIATPVTLIWFRKLDRLENAYRLLSSHAHELARTASIDPLTGAFNRRHFIEQFDNAMELVMKRLFRLQKHWNLHYLRIA